MQAVSEEEGEEDGSGFKEDETDDAAWQDSFAEG